MARNLTFHSEHSQRDQYISTSSEHLEDVFAAVMVALNFFPLAGAISSTFLRGLLGSDMEANNLARRDLSFADTDAGLHDGYLNFEDTLSNDDVGLIATASFTP